MSVVRVNVVTVVALCLILVLVHAESVNEIRDDSSGSWGGQVNWVYNVSTQTLTIIGGGGRMADLGAEDQVPWYAFRKSIKTVVFEGILLSIGSFAFKGCTSLLSITIPYAVDHLGESVFAGCTSLTAIHVDEDNGAFKEIEGVLFDVDGTILMVYPSGRHGGYEIPNGVKEIYNSAFEECSYLTSVIIPEGLTQIGRYAFSSCKGLTHMIIPASVSVIGGCAFVRCPNLARIEVNENNNAYSSNGGVLFNKAGTKLEVYPNGKKDMNYIVPDQVKTIGVEAFSNTVWLRHIVIPSNVDSIKEAAFKGCLNLEAVSYLGLSDPDNGPSVFSDCEKLGAICVPLGYKTSSFCGKSDILCERGTCDMLEESENGCFRALCKNNKFLVEERAESIEWKKSSNGCVEYQCDNKTGIVPTNKCKSTSNGMSVCKDNKCVKEDESKPTKEWTVNITIGEEDLIALNTTAISKTICDLMQTNCDDIEVEVEMDENGRIVNLIIYVDDEELAKRIEDTALDCHQ